MIGKTDVAEGSPYVRLHAGPAGSSDDDGALDRRGDHWTTEVDGVTTTAWS